MLGWIQNTQEEVLFANATHYRIESIRFRLYDLKIYEWTTINGEERFIKKELFRIIRRPWQLCKFRQLIENYKITKQRLRNTKSKLQRLRITKIRIQI